MSTAPSSSDVILAGIAGAALGAAVAAAAFSATCFVLSRASPAASTRSPSRRAASATAGIIDSEPTCNRVTDNRLTDKHSVSDYPCRGGPASCRCDMPAPAQCSHRRWSCARSCDAESDCATMRAAQGGEMAVGLSETRRRMGNGAAEAPPWEEVVTIGDAQAGIAAQQTAERERECSIGGCEPAAGEREGGGGGGGDMRDGGLEIGGSLREDGRKKDPYDARKRSGYLSWDDYFMAVAFLSAQRSKDPNRQVGACIVSSDHVILGIGYNGFPRGISDDALPWAKLSARQDPLETKYPYVCHAEVNALLNTNHASAPHQRLYVTLFPCNDCAKVIIQAGIKEVIFFADKPSSRNPKDIAYAASRKLLELAGVKVWQHRPKRHSLTLTFV